MSSATARIPLEEARAIGREFIGLIEPYCERVVLAGSIRRERPDVGDIEVVAIPRVSTAEIRDMFDELLGTTEVDLLDGHLDLGLDLGLVRKRVSEKGATAWGPKHKRLIFEDAPVDLFCTTVDQWGLILAIRTGPAEYSHALVSPPNLRLPSGRVGMLPEMYRVRDGWLTYRVSGERIPTPTEEDFFRTIGVPYADPEDRP